MTRSPLDNLADVGQLRRQPADAGEFAGLVRSGTARLADARNTSLSIESRFDIAYNAAHALSLASLRRSGYRPVNRYIVFQTLPHTLGLSAEVWRVLDRCHSLRNRGEYEGARGGRLVVRGGRDAIHVAARLKAENVPVILTETMAAPDRPYEGYDAAYGTPAKLHAAG
jgi:hypothetical protein